MTLFRRVQRVLGTAAVAAAVGLAGVLGFGGGVAKGAGDDLDELGDAAPVARPEMAHRLVKLWDFEERALGNVETVPQNWFRAQNNPPESPRPGFPAWNLAAFDDTIAFSGGTSVKLPTAGGSTSLTLARGVLPAMPGGRYLVTAMVRTGGLAHARAVLRARLYDTSFKLLSGPGAQAASEPVLSEGKWTGVQARLDAGEDAAWLQIDLEVLQPAQMEGAAPMSQEIRAQDFSGAAWFDDVGVFQIPTLDLATRSPTGVIVDPQLPELVMKVRDLTGEPLKASIKVYDLEGNEVASQTADLPPGGRTLAWSPSLPAHGWYRASMLVSGPVGVVGQRRADFAWLSPARSIEATAMTPWGVLVEDIQARQLPRLPELMDVLAVGSVSLPVWSHIGLGAPGEHSWDETDAVVNRLIEQRREVTLVLARMPDDLARGARLDPEDVIALLADPTQDWMSGISPMLSRFGERVMRWQVGPTGNDRAFWRPALTADMAAISKAFRRLIPRPVLSVPWKLEQSAWRGARAGANLTMEAPETVPAESLPQYSQQWSVQEGADKSASTPEVTLVLQPPSVETFGRRAAVEELTRRAVTAWSAGVPRLAIRAPWTWDATDPERAMPDVMLPVWRTIAQHLSGRLPAGSMPVAPGVVAFLAQGQSDGAVVAWNSRAESSAAVLSGYLGPGPITVTDPFGNTATLSGDESRHIQLTSMPVFIEGVDVNLLRFRASVHLEPAYLPARAERHTISLVIENPWRIPITGTIRLAEPAQWEMSPRIIPFTLQSGEKKVVPFTVSLGVGEQAGTRAILAELTLTSERRYPSLLLSLPVELGLETVQMLPSYRYVPGADGTMSDVIITALVTNLGPVPITMEAFVQAPGLRGQQAPVSALAPGESVIRRFVFAGAAKQLRGKQVLVGLKEVAGTGRLNKVIEVQ